MRWGRIVLGSVAVAVFHAVYGALTCGWLFSWVYKIPPVEVWKPVENAATGFWLALNAGTLVMAFFTALIFGIVFKALPGKCTCGRGLVFGIFVWLLGILPGMFSMYMFTVIAPAVLLYWLISGLVSMLLTGVIISVIYGKREGDKTCVCACS